MTSPLPHGMPRTLRRVFGGLTTTVSAVTAAALLLGAPAPSSGPAGTDSATVASTSAELQLVAAERHRWPGHPGRAIVRYRVKPGDTATGLAVRFHAWTRELRAINHLGRHAHLYVGQRIRIPVVRAAVRKHHRAHHRTHHRAHHRTHHRAHHRTHHRAHHGAHHRAHHRPARRHDVKPWRQADASRATVRRLIVRSAHYHGVPSRLALAIAWQESGWQQRRISSAGAVGALQVLPGTGRWMSTYVGRRLNIYGLWDNVTAGVKLIDVLRGQTSQRRAIAAYYQGLGAVREHGMYPSTRAYVRNVLALRQRMRHGWNPA